MSNKSGVSSTSRHQPNPGTAATSLTAAITRKESPSIGGGFGLQNHPSDKVPGAQFCPPPLAKEYFNASFGTIIEGHYTEF
jgi:hypothetical protein